MSSDLEQQLRCELEHALAGPVAALLGADVGGQVRTRIDSQASLLASQLASGNRRIAGRLTTRLLDEVLYPDGWPPVQWWTTPLGFALARWYRPAADVVITIQEAGELLDLTEQTIAKPIGEETLQPGQEAGTVTLASALAYLSGGPTPSAEPYGRAEQVRGLARRLWHRIRRGFYVPPGGDRGPVILGVVAFVLGWLSLCWVGTIVGIVLGVKAQRRANDLGQDDLVPKIGWITAVIVGILDILGWIFLQPTFSG